MKYNGVTSERNAVFNGVSQGSILGPLLFLIFFNDLPDCLHHSQNIKYTDETVLFISSKDFHVIETKLSEDLSHVGKWFLENEIIMNMKKGKTECMLFDTSKRLSKTPSALSVNYQQSNINVAITYKYLGVEIDSSLNLNSHFDKSYKKCSGRLRLLSRLRQHLDIKSSKLIYQLMIQPVLTYCGVLLLGMSETNLNKIDSLDKRALSIIGGSNDIRPIQSQIRLRACLLVRKCIDGDVCDNFVEYFDEMNHSQNTRNNNISLRLPRVATEYAKKGFYYRGAKEYNNLPLKIRMEKSIAKFKLLLKEHFAP